MSGTPLLSVVVPTKNRYKYLFYLIELIDGFKSDEIELVIQDNSDDNAEMLDYLDKHNYPFLKYNYLTGSLSVKDNSDHAILNSSGEYVCFLGDDDGLLPSVVPVIRHMKENSVDYLISLPSFYNWPDFYDPSIFSLSSAISYIRGTGKYRTLDPMKELRKSSSNGFDGLYRMPKVYQGVTSRSILNRIYERCGTFFPGPSPDMANAVALSLLNGKFMMYDGPLFISGQCRSFGGGERVIGAGLKKITEVPFLPKNITETWSKHLPTYWCADMIWPQSAIEAMKAMGADVEVNYEQIIANFVFNHAGYRKESLDLVENKTLYRIYYLRYAFKKAYAFLSHRLSFYLSFKSYLSPYRLVHNVNNIIDAVNYLENAK